MIFITNIYDFYAIILKKYLILCPQINRFYVSRFPKIEFL